jgi:hypothetical protein
MTQTFFLQEKHPNFLYVVVHCSRKNQGKWADPSKKSEMSRHFIEAFFPAMSQILSETRLYQTIFPMDVVELCPAIQIESLSLRNPILFIQACIGVGMGLMMGCYFSSHPAVGWWRTAFVSFGLMNLVAIPLHCFVSESSKNMITMRMPYSETHGILWFLDCYFTGVSAMSIIASIFKSYGSNQTHYPAWVLWLCHIYGIGSGIIWFLWSWTLPLELWYLVPIGASCLVVAY